MRGCGVSWGSLEGGEEAYQAYAEDEGVGVDGGGVVLADFEAEGEFFGEGEVGADAEVDGVGLGEGGGGGVEHAGVAGCGEWVEAGGGSRESMASVEK